MTKRKREDKDNVAMACTERKLELDTRTAKEKAFDHPLFSRILDFASLEDMSNWIGTSKKNAVYIENGCMEQWKRLANLAIQSQFKRHLKNTVMYVFKNRHTATQEDLQTRCDICKLRCLSTTRKRDPCNDNFCSACYYRQNAVEELANTTSVEAVRAVAMISY